MKHLSYTLSEEGGRLSMYSLNALLDVIIAKDQLIKTRARR